MEQNRKMKPEIFLMILAVLVFGFFAFLVQSYTADVMKVTEKEENELNRVYDYHYELIVDSRNETFWQEVYEKAKAEAAENNALVSIMKAGWFDSYDKVDYVDMCIASRVDGIILEYNGEKGLTKKIKEAMEKGIPVVTIVNDLPESGRQSFVGVNDYQLGQTYGALVADLVDKSTEEIMIVSNRAKGIEKNQLYAQIYNAVADSAESSKTITVKEENLVSQSQFDVEEAVRSILQAREGAPQILICLDEVTTECAYQAMIDFNMVGEVNIIGYYTSDTILDAVKKGLIPATVCMDASQIGKYSIEALTEYQEIGRSNSYYTVDLQTLTAENWEEQEEDHE